MAEYWLEQIGNIAEKEGREVNEVLKDCWTYYQKITGGNEGAFNCSAYSNGYHGGDAGHGGECEFVLEKDQAFWEVEIEDEDGKPHKFEIPRCLKVTAKGDWELDGFRVLAKYILDSFDLPVPK